jgi:predicted dehydrogenase
MVGPIEEVFAYTARRVLELPTGDVVTVQLRFKDGTTGSISAISATPFYGRIAVFGSQGWAEARETSHPDDPDIVHFFTKFNGDERQEMRVLEPYDGVVANFEAWADAVAGRHEYRFSDEERFANVAVLEAIARSAASGAPEAVVQYQADE